MELKFGRTVVFLRRSLIATADQELGRYMNNGVKIGIVAVIVIVIGAYFVIKPEEKTEIQPEEVVPAQIEQVIEPEPEEVVEAEPPTDPRPVEDPIVLPPETLNESDGKVMMAIEKISPTIAQWVVPEEQVRKLVLAVDLLADGKLPLRHKPLEYPIPTFAVESLNDDEFVSEDSNAERMNSLINAVTAIPPKTMGRYYQAWLPLLEKAYGELGKEDEFKTRVDEAVNRILAAEDIEEDERLVQPHVFYQFEDKTLEQKSALDKALWRMGKENREKLQAYLKELKFYL